MDRRSFILGVGGTLGLVATGGVGAYVVTGGNNQSGDSAPKSREVSEDEIPEKIQAVQPLAKDFTTEITSHFDGKVFISKQAELIFQYESDAESRSSLDTEFSQIADVYGDVVKNGDHDPVTLSMIVGPVQGIVPEPSLTAYVNGEINKEAYLKTVEVTDVGTDSDGN